MQTIVNWIERATGAYTLFVVFVECTDNMVRQQQLYAEMFRDKRHRLLYGYKSVSFTAAWTAYRADDGKAVGSHDIGIAPRLHCHRGGAGYYAIEDAATHCRAATAPESACSSGHLAAAQHHLAHCLVEIHVSACITVCRQQCGTYYDMIFRTM